MSPVKLNNPYKQFIIVYIAWWMVWLVCQTIAIHYMAVGWKSAFADSLVSTLLIVLAG